MSLGSSCAGAVVVVVEVLRFRPDSNPEDEIALLGLTVVVKNCGSGVIIITRIIVTRIIITCGSGVLPVIAAILAGSLGGASAVLGVSSRLESSVSS